MANLAIKVINHNVCIGDVYIFSDSVVNTQFTVVANFSDKEFVKLNNGNHEHYSALLNEKIYIKVKQGAGPVLYDPNIE